MKKIVILMMAALWAPLAFASEGANVAAMWERGNGLYSAGDYNGAILTYDSIVNEGWQSAALYYNLGGACFKAGRNGLAILNYHRALRLEPSNDDVAYNLAYAESFVRDNIDVIPTGVVERLMTSIRRLMSADGWGVASLVALGLAFVAAGFYILAQSRRLRKWGFFVALAALVVFFCSLGFGGAARGQLLAQDEAVVLMSASSVKASPEESSKDLFILHEGTKVEVLDSFGEWSEIRIADGNEGWIRTSAIELI